MWDRERGPADPGGTLADRFTPEGLGKWNLLMEGVDPVMSMLDLPGSERGTGAGAVAAGGKDRGAARAGADGASAGAASARTGAGVDAVEILLPRFDRPGSATPTGSIGGGVVRRGVPVARLEAGRAAVEDHTDMTA